MAAVMGFSTFDSTHGKAIADNHKGPGRGAVHRTLQRKYRQFMNRKGGFNRPLDQQPAIRR